MGWKNPPVPWSDLARSLAGGPPPGDHGDSPAWGRHRESYRRPGDLPAHGTDDGGEAVRVQDAELH